MRTRGKNVENVIYKLPDYACTDYNIKFADMLSPLYKRNVRGCKSWTNQLYRHQCKMSSSKKLTCKRTLRQVFFCLGPPPLLGFCLGWSSNFLNLVRYSVINTSRIWSPTRTVCIIDCTLIQGKGGGRVEPERRLQEQPFTKLGRKYQHNWLYLQFINSDKHLSQSHFT